MGMFRLIGPAIAALALAGCASGGNLGGYFGSSPQQEAAVQPQAEPEIPGSIRAEEVVGRWGLASFHNPADRVRTEANARGQCRQPYSIQAGPTGGVMMYLADQSQLQELRIKGGPQGRNYVGPPGPGGGPQDREIVSFDGRVMVMRHVDPEIAGRYGTEVFVRCGPTAGVAQKGKQKKK